MRSARFETIKRSVRKTALWIGCLALLMPPGIAFVQEPDFRSLETFRPQNQYVRHAGRDEATLVGEGDQVPAPADAELAEHVGDVRLHGERTEARDASFRIVPGLADKNCISFEATNVRDHYFKHAFSRVVLAKRLDEKKFREDATFCVVPGLRKTARSGTGSVSLRSFNFPDRYIRHRDFELWLDPFENTTQYRDDATFFMVRPATPAVAKK